MSDQHIDGVLKMGAPLGEPPDPKLVAAIVDSIKPGLKPVRVLPSTWVLAAGLTMICALVALGGAARTGFYGFADLGIFARVIIFSALGILAWVVGTAFADEMIPGSLRFATAGALLAFTTAALLILFGFLFRDYHTRNFISAGIICLTTGLLHALPAGLLGWVLLRRGFAVRPVTAGMIGGTLAGLAGIGMLELHCNNFQALHILLWHTAVVPAAAGAGAIAGWAVTRSARRE